MKYSLSPCIPLVTSSSSQSPLYQWDDWDPYRLLGEGERRVAIVLRAISDRAKLAFSIACAEWVVTRLQPFLDEDPAPWQFIEACWAFQMTRLYALPPESDESMWQGIIRAPIDLSLMTILNTAIGIEDENAEIDAAFAAKIVLHVIENRKEFLRWQRLVLRRLRLMYPYLDEDKYGEVVPREIFVLSNNFERQLAKKFVSAFLKRIDVGANPYLIEINK